MAIHLVIFDLDARSLTHRVDITNALITPGALLLCAALVEDTVKMIGEGITRLIEKLVGERDTSMKADVTERLPHLLHPAYPRLHKGYPGVRDTLEKLNSYQKAVISNKNESCSRRVLTVSTSHTILMFIIGSDTHGRGSPLPCRYSRYFPSFMLQSGEALIVGDSNYDVDAGKAAGITTVAVTYGYRPRVAHAHADFLTRQDDDLVRCSWELRASGVKEFTLDSIRDIRLYQSRNGYRFSVDALLLYSFVNVPRAKRIADLGAGSGILGLLLAKKYPDAHVSLFELQERLATLAKKNITLNSVGERIKLIKADIREITPCSPASGMDCFDIAVSNPPFRNRRQDS